MKRVTLSAGPPAVNGTMILIGCEGYAAAPWACAQPANHSMTKRNRRTMGRPFEWPSFFGLLSIGANEFFGCVSD